MTNRELGAMIENWWQEEVVNIRDMRGDSFPFDDAEDLADVICTDALMWAEDISETRKAEYMSIERNQKAVKMCEALAYCHLPEGFGDTDAERFNGFVAYISYLYTKEVIRKDGHLRLLTSGKFFVNFGVCEMLVNASNYSYVICKPDELVLSEIKAIFD